MKGGGYRNFLEQVRMDGSANCLAKFIIIDGDRAVKEEGEKRILQELLEYCILQKSIDQFKSDARIYHVLHTNGNSSAQMLSALRKDRCFVRNDYTVNKKQFEIKVKTFYDWQKLGSRGSNIDEFFGVLECFHP